MKRTAKPPPPAAAKGPRSRLVRAEAPARAVKAAVPPEKAPRSRCPINLTLEKVGDSWTMLIIRDLMLRGHTGYQAFLRSEEKIATNILADRLARLEQNGLVEKKPDPADARKFIYSLTENGADLAPLLVELALYSLKHERRTDMPKDVAAEMQRNKPVFVSKLIRANAPKSVARRGRKVEPREMPDETLSLF
jgi:DNA-binding HxlR family transcriptional regulator